MLESMKEALVENMIERNQKSIVDEFAKRIRRLQNMNVLQLHWFGSRARNSGTADSDFDFLIETDEPLSESQRNAVADIAVDISADYGVLLDLHFYTAKELREPPYAHTPFVQSILEEGVFV